MASSRPPPTGGRSRRGGNAGRERTSGLRPGRAPAGTWSTWTTSQAPRAGPGSPDQHGHPETLEQATGRGARNHGLFWAACRALEQGHGDDLLDALRLAAVRAGLPDWEV